MKIIIDGIRIGASLAGIHSLATAIAVLRSMLTVAVLLSAGIASAANIASVTATDGGLVIVYVDGTTQSAPLSGFVDARTGAPQPPGPPGPDDPDPPAGDLQSKVQGWYRDHVTGENKDVYAKLLAELYAGGAKAAREGKVTTAQQLVNETHDMRKKLLDFQDETANWKKFGDLHNAYMASLPDNDNLATIITAWEQTAAGLRGAVPAHASDFWDDAKKLLFELLLKFLMQWLGGFGL